MCGIAGYIRPSDAVPIVLEGLQRLEYRGYDSSGIAAIADNSLCTVWSVGKLLVLASNPLDTPLCGSLDICHTRLATHGALAEANAHPRTDESHSFVVVRNGIIENYSEIGGFVIAIATEGDSTIAKSADRVVFVPKRAEPHSPLLTILLLQVLAYQITVASQPRQKRYS